MKLPSGLHRSHEFGAMTSMIDVVLFLLMFFVVTSGSGQMAQLLPVPLSRAGSVESKQAVEPADAVDHIDIWLKLKFDQTGRRTLVDMNGTVYESLGELKEQLRVLADLDRENPIIFETAPDVPLGDVVTIYDTCQAAGFDSISFAARKP
ncbi:ExbD/TolR family protein [Planctomicrobium sp. SH527]|uniref:ExbD/TolR family protein n=1 Tax=Planctomicrobium sp. SH527 TaxID=3448123 RepID=UPI003F5B423F